MDAHPYISQWKHVNDLTFSHADFDLVSNIRQEFLSSLK